MYLLINNLSSQNLFTFIIVIRNKYPIIFCWMICFLYVGGGIENRFVILSCLFDKSQVKMGPFKHKNMCTIQWSVLCRFDFYIYWSNKGRKQCKG